jgi:signal peptidase II
MGAGVRTAYTLSVITDFRRKVIMKVLSPLMISLLVALGLDGLSKILAERFLALHQPVPVIDDFFRLTLGYNTGVAFGMFANGGLAPLVVTGVIITGLVIWFGRSLYTGHFPGQAAWPIGLLLGGAIGNFVDRLPDKRVTDFLDVGLGAARWPTFNLADSFILIGVTLLMLTTFSHKPQPAPPPLDDTPSENEVNSLFTN